MNLFVQESGAAVIIIINSTQVTQIEQGQTVHKLQIATFWDNNHLQLKNN